MPGMEGEQATREPPQTFFCLTDRVHEVQALLVEGLRNPQIPERLVVSRSTVGQDLLD